jgi:hypothetical protein
VVTTQCNVPTNVTVFHTSVHSISGYVTPYTFDLRYVFERQGMLHELRVSRRDPKIYNAEKDSTVAIGDTQVGCNGLRIVP